MKNRTVYLLIVVSLAAFWGLAALFVADAPLWGAAVVSAFVAALLSPIVPPKQR